MIWYKTQYDGKVKEIEVEKETEKFIYVKDFRGYGICRIQKRGSYANYFKTKKEAVDFMIKEAENKKKILENNIKSLNELIDRIKLFNFL